MLIAILMAGVFALCLCSIGFSLYRLQDQMVNLEKQIKNLEKRKK